MGPIDCSDSDVVEGSQIDTPLFYRFWRQYWIDVVAQWWLKSRIIELGFPSPVIISKKNAAFRPIPEQADNGPGVARETLHRS